LPYCTGKRKNVQGGCATPPPENRAALNDVGKKGACHNIITLTKIAPVTGELML
jgi:hypothetical protein